MTQQPFNRRFGVEIEILSNVSTNTILTAVRAEGINIEFESYTHRVTSHWKIVRDVSCGLELVSPVLEGEPGLAEVEKVTKALNQIGAQVNRNCGMHVHLDASAMTLKAIKNLFKLWTKFEEVLDTFQPMSRRGNANRFILSNVPGDYKAAFQLIDNCKSVDEIRNLYPSRYRKLNIHPYFRQQTIEVRHHSGTTDGSKITSWVRLMGAMFDKAQSSTAILPWPANTAPYSDRAGWFFKTVNAKGVKKFFMDRAKQLAAA
jgi:hypothetical protein